jgi:hypothetical protein
LPGLFGAVVQDPVTLADPVKGAADDLPLLWFRQRAAATAQEAGPTGQRDRAARVAA